MQLVGGETKIEPVSLQILHTLVRNEARQWKLSRVVVKIFVLSQQLAYNLLVQRVSKLRLGLRVYVIQSQVRPVRNCVRRCCAIVWTYTNSCDTVRDAVLIRTVEYNIALLDMLRLFNSGFQTLSARLHQSIAVTITTVYYVQMGIFQTE